MLKYLCPLLIATLKIDGFFVVIFNKDSSKGGTIGGIESGMKGGIERIHKIR
jgi:hypothetical protein